jgi:acetyl esterase
MKNTRDLPLLFTPKYGELAADFAYDQLFDDIPEAKNASNRDSENARKIKFLHGLHGNAPLSVRTEDRYYEREGGKSRVRIYTPGEKALYPIVVFYHGGGWSWLSIDAYDYECENIAKGADCIVVSVEYRFAPEHKFPIGIEDSYSALEWVASSAPTFHGDNARIGLAGDSSGGNFAAALSLMYWERRKERLAAQALIYPCVNLDPDMSAGSFARYGKGYALDIDPSAGLGESIGYISRQEERFDYRASPLLAEDLSTAPPTLIVCGECDVLLDDCLRYAKRLEDEGVLVRFRLFEGMPHSFIQMVNKEAKAAMGEIVTFLKERLRD